MKIGPYEVLESLFSGPRPLYKVKNAEGKILALKTAPVNSLSAEMRERFNREAQACSNLDHPNVIRVYDYGESDGVLYQAMDLLEGADLGKIFSAGRQFAWEHRLSIMEQACDGLHYAHERGLVHRDIKPANIFIEFSGRVRVLDFGMARIDASTLTQAGSALGTLNYMAPEQVRAQVCTRASDIFSLGIVYYQLASGRHPFSDKNSNIASIMNSILFEQPPSLATIAPDAPEGLEFILSKALEKDPARRLQSAADLKQTLSLCRVTIKLRANRAGPQSGGVPAAAAPAIGEKTVVVRVPPVPPAPVPPPPPAQTAPPPPRPPAAPATKAPAPPPAPPSAPPTGPRSGGVRIAPPPPDAVYCASCTHANPAGSQFCQRCGQPLGQRSTQTSGAGMGGTWALAVIVSGVFLLVVILALIWLSR